MRPLFALVLLLAACDGGAARLVVDLRTDYVVGEEIACAELAVEGVADPLMQCFAPSAELAEGARVAELDGLTEGPRRITLRLLAPSGRVVATRVAIVTLAQSTVATLVVTRNCEGVVCDEPSAPACIDARCVPAGCIVEDVDACGDEATCEPRTCSASVACADAECVGGFCVPTPDSSRCMESEFCHSSLDCQPRTQVEDAGPGVDAGADDAGAVDAGALDAGPPGTDAGFDGGPPAGCTDLLEPNEDPDVAADNPVVTDFGIGAMHSETGLSVCGADEDWIGIGSLGVVVMRGSLMPSLPMGGDATVCVELFTWSELRRTLMDPPVPQGSMVCGPANVPLNLGPVTGSLDGGGNYILLRVTAMGAPVDYDLSLTGSLT